MNVCTSIHLLVNFTANNIPQGSMAKNLNCDRISTDHFTAN